MTYPKHRILVKDNSEEMQELLIITAEGISLSITLNEAISQ